MTAEEVRQKVASGSYRSSDFAWKEGMSNWLSIADAGVLAEASLSGVGSSPQAIAQAAVQPVVQPMGGANPYAAPVSAPSVAMAAMGQMEYPGIGRLRYFLFIVGISVAMSFGVVSTIGAMFGSAGWSASGASWAIFWVVLAAGLIGLIAVAVKRLANLGMSGWMVLLGIVPILHWWLFWRLIACPEGYDDHKSLDTSGKVMTVVYILWVLGGLVSDVSDLSSTY